MRPRKWKTERRLDAAVHVDGEHFQLDARIGLWLVATMHRPPFLRNEHGWNGP